MGTQFYAAKAPIDPANLMGWKLGKLFCDMSGSNTGRMLILLGYPETEVPELSIGGECPVTEFLLRLSVAQIKGVSTARQRFGWPAEYVQLRLAELTAVAREAERMGGEVAWARSWPPGTAARCGTTPQRACATPRAAARARPRASAATARPGSP